MTEIERLRLHIADLQRENRYLRRLTKNLRHGRMLRQATADAHTLIAWRFSGLCMSRRNVLIWACRNDGG